MTSVNKIKELANAREYSLALEIIDSQDLSKSLNPQFIRLCGDVYIANKRYKDARKVLVMAHRMAPEAKRVIYSLVDLYLRMGYKELASFYYKLYMFDAEPNLPQTDHMNYIYNKAQGCPFQEIETLLFPMYSDVMDYDWSFELFLLMKLQGKEEEAKRIKDDYLASFKNEPNAILLEEIEESGSEDRIKELFYIYSKDNVTDDSLDEEKVRNEERPLLEADELRMNPKEAEIQILFEDNEKASFGAKLKYKRHIREQERLAKKAESGEPAEDHELNSTDNSEVGEMLSQPMEQVDENVLDSSDKTEALDTKTGIFKKLFSKIKKEDGTETDNADETVFAEATMDAEKTEIVEAEVEEPVEENKKLDIVEVENPVEEHKDSAVDEAEETDESIEEVEESRYEETIGGLEGLTTTFEIDTEIKDTNNVNYDVEEVVHTEENIDSEWTDIDENDYDSVVQIQDDVAEDESEQESLDVTGDSEMHEIYEKKKISIVTEIGEDSFANTQEFGQSYASGNPFEQMQKQETKSSFVFEEVQLQPEEEEFEVDDFTESFESLGFEETDINTDSVVTEENVESIDVNNREAGTTEVNEYAEAEATEVNEYAEVETTEVNEYGETETIEVEEYPETVEVNAYFETEISEDEETAESAVIEEYAGIESAEVEEYAETETIEVEEYADEENITEAEEYVEAETTETEMYNDSDIACEQNSTEFKVENTFNNEYDFNFDLDSELSEHAKTDSYADVNTGYVDSLGGESVYQTLKVKGNLDYPEFKSTLFPEYGQEIVSVENNFDEIMSVAQDKINENLLKEEQMQREAEALLASLGIDLGSIQSTVKPNNANESLYTKVDSVSTFDSVEQTVIAEVEEETTEIDSQTTNNYSPSRDELKASLKIDSVKKNILKQIKEYR
ncbi:MAG: hypothetical protein IKJ73_05580 [Lachnospiraceae bacterium]|nr:hypothetical protein [Lachnospiraceae bacterium]